MNLTLHLIRKDLRALRWPLLLWIAACLTHLGLRLAQFARGDAAPLTPFWRGIETTHRWDHTAVFALPVLIIPVLLHLDPLRGALSFWKTVPISRARLLTAKSLTLIAFFIALPFVCEVVYFLKAGLSVVLANALADWAWRFLPGIAAVVLGCAFTRSLKVGVPGVALALWLAAIVFQWPYGRDRIANPLLGRAAPKPPGLIAPPAGSRIEIVPKSVQFARINYKSDAAPGGDQWTEERLAATLRLHASGLPADVLVSSLRLQGANVQLPGRTLEETDEASKERSIRYFGTELMNTEMFARGTNGNPGQLPAQEQREEFGSNNSRIAGMDANEWSASSGYFRVAAKDVPPTGALIEGKVLVSLVRRRLIATLPIVEGAQWRPGLHRFTLSDVPPSQATLVNFHARLTTVLADPRGDTGQLALTPASNFALWIEHASLPFRKRLITIPSASWRAERTALSAPNLFAISDAASTTDITRSRKRTDFAPSFDPVAAMRNGATPLTVARFAEEQAQVRNWHLALYTYEDLGSVEIPLKAVVPRPSLASDEEDAEDKLKPPPPSLGLTLAEVNIPANPSRAEAEQIFARIADLAKPHRDDSIRRHENLLLKKLAALGPDHLEVLLAAARDALQRGPVREFDPRYFDHPDPRNRQEWLLKEENWNRSNAFWRRVIIVACDIARPGDKEVILRFHSPTVNLLRAIEPHGWENDALPAMCAVAAGELVPESWLNLFARHPEPQTRAALLAQIRQRNIAPFRVAEFIASGALPGREAATVLWETAVANTGNLEALTPAFPLAVKHGVEIIPRDLLRIMRFKRDDVAARNDTPFKTVQSAFVQSFSLRSECPPTVAAAGPWLEQNAFALPFDDASGRYQADGIAAPPIDPAKWGEVSDPVGAGSARVDGDALTLTAAGTIADFWNTRQTSPRVMREVEGDFTAEVTAHPAFDPGPAWDRHNPNAIFQSAGLLVDAGSERWIRWEQALEKNPGVPSVREETFRSGRNAVFARQTKEWDPKKPVRLRLSRHGDLFTTAWNQEDGAWVESPAQRNLGWPRKVRAGLLIVNTCARPLLVRFTDFKIESASAEPLALADPIPSHPDGEPTPDGAQLGDYGTVANPIRSGIFKTEGGTLSLDVAPNAPSDYFLPQRLTAPRVLREIEGDFTLEATIAPTPRKDYNSAELLIAAGADFYLRIGLAVNNGGKLFFTSDYAERGRPAGIVNLEAARDFTKPIRIRLQRRGWLLTVAHQQDGGEWTEFYPLNLRAWPEKIQAGVAALNTSNEPFTAVFSDFKLTRDAK